jgi:hypothetical protein
VTSSELPRGRGLFGPRELQGVLRAQHVEIGRRHADDQALLLCGQLGVGLGHLRFGTVEAHPAVPAEYGLCQAHSRRRVRVGVLKVDRFAVEAVRVRRAAGRQVGQQQRPGEGRELLRCVARGPRLADARIVDDRLLVDLEQVVAQRWSGDEEDGDGDERLLHGGAHFKRHHDDSLNY